MTTAQHFPYSEDPEDKVAVSSPSITSRLKGIKPKPGQPPSSEPDELEPKEPKKRQQTRTLRGRLLLALLPTTLLPLAIISSINYLISQQEIQKEQEFTLKKVALTAGEIGSQFVNDLKTDVEVVSINPLLQQAIQSADQEAAQKQLTQVPIERLEEYYNSSRAIQQNTTLNSYLQNISDKKELEETFATNRDGFNVAYSKITSDFVQNDEAWWQGAKENGFYIEPPEYDESSNSYVLPLSTSIQDLNTNNFLGVIKAGASLEKLNNTLQEILEGTIKELTQVQIIDPFTNQMVASVNSDAEGLVTVTPVSELVEQVPAGGEVVTKIAASFKEAVDSGQTPEQLAAGLKQAHSLEDVQVNQFSSETSNLLTALFSTDQRKYAVTTVSGTNWVAISSIDTAELRAVSNDILIQFLIFGSILSAAAVVIILRLARQVSTPINQLSEAANQMAAGDLDVTAAESGTLETRQLAGTFNNLVQQVKALLQRQRDETSRAQLLAAIAQSTSSSDMQVPLNQYLDGIRTKLAADRVVIYRFKPDMSGYIAGEAIVAGWPKALGSTIDDSCIPQQLIDAYKQGRVVPTEDVMQAGFHPDHQQLMVRLQIKANLVVPVVIAGELLGLLVAHHCAQTHAWEADEIETLREAGEQLGIAMTSLVSLEFQKAAAEEQQRRRQDLEMQILNMMERIEGAVDGDLTTRAQLMEGEIGIVADLFNAVIENLQDIAIQVRDSSGQVNKSLTENEEAIRQLAEKAILEANVIQEALGSVQSVSQAIDTVAQNAEKASGIANSAYETVQKGNQAMDQTVGSILGLRTTIGNTAKKMKRLGESAQKISQVVSLIDELALKTNLLSINASVEAARAGELGQGFTAVAEQVGALAEQSASATREIAKIVTSIQSETQELVEAMETGTTQVVDSTHQVEQTKLQLAEVLQRSQEIDRLMRAISESAIAQAESTQSVTTVMGQVAKSSKQRSLESREVAQAMQATAHISRKMQASVEQFKVD